MVPYECVKSDDLTLKLYGRIFVFFPLSHLSCFNRYDYSSVNVF